MDVLWACDSKEQLLALLQSLPVADRRTCAALVEVAAAGGDMVTDLTEARKVIEKIRAIPL